MTTPTNVSFSQVNTEMSNDLYTIPSNQIISMSNNWVRNVANTQSGQINAGKLRWGINFAGRYILNDTGILGTTVIGRSNYHNNPNVSLTTSYYALYSSGSPPTSPTTANVRISFFANGNMEFRSNGTGLSTVSNTKIWLTTPASTNGNYTIQFQRTGGAVTSGSATNTDLAMNTTIYWDVGSRTTSTSDSDFARGNLIVKYDGTELIRRPVSLDTSVQFEAV